MPTRIETIQDMLTLELSAASSGEQQLTSALSKMAQAADERALKDALETHLQETRAQLDRVSRIAKLCNVELSGEKCPIIEAMIGAVDSIIERTQTGPVRDALLIAAAQKIEHAEIATYGTIIAFARQIGIGEAVEVLQQTLDEEVSADRKLTMIAENLTNRTAISRAA